MNYDALEKLKDGEAFASKYIWQSTIENLSTECDYGF